MFSEPQLLTAEHSTALFDCENLALNSYLQKFALQNNAAGGARTYVTTPVSEKRVVGYYSVTAGSVERRSAPDRVGKGMPNHPIPVVLVARLAVDRDFQGRGLGKGLLRDALTRSLSVSEAIGVRAVLVHAKDSDAARFYATFGFEPSPTDPLHLYLLIKDLKKSAGLV
jgi:GNAT superfamily N-acetyltransferase